MITRSWCGLVADIRRREISAARSPRPVAMRSRTRRSSPVTSTASTAGTGAVQRLDDRLAREIEQAAPVNLRRLRPAGKGHPISSGPATACARASACLGRSRPPRIRPARRQGRSPRRCVICRVTPSKWRWMKTVDTTSWIATMGTIRIRAARL
jgi:hypothetical protein